MAKTGYKRVLLKLSGEAFSGGAGFGIDAATLKRISEQVNNVVQSECGSGHCSGWEAISGAEWRRLKQMA
jgi:uridylate kinase